MSQEFGTPSTSPLVSSPSWSEVWINALTRPSVATFEGFVQDPNATDRRAYTWVFVSSLTSFAIPVVLSTLLVAVLGTDMQGGLWWAKYWSMLMASICAPFGAAFTLIVFVIIAGITQLIAGALGGTGTYSKLVYAFAAYMAPLTLIQLTLIHSVLSPMPLITYLPYPLRSICLPRVLLVVTPTLWIYGIVLNVIAVKAVHKFGWGKAIASSLVFVGILVLVACVVIGILYCVALFVGNLFHPGRNPEFNPYTLLPLGPVVGNLFSNIKGRHR
jgi:hypothetical protein